MKSKKFATDKGVSIAGMNISLQSSLPYIKHELEKKKPPQQLIQNKKAFQEDISGYALYNEEQYISQTQDNRNYADIMIQYPNGPKASSGLSDHVNTWDGKN